MSSTVTGQTPAPPAGARPRGSRRVWNVLVGAWAAVTGIAPHVLHHVGPLAGTALVAGAGGQFVFGMAGLVLLVPTLLRLRRRFGSWIAPAIALVVFGGVFALSTLVVGPRISGLGSDDSVTESADHDAHEHTEGPAPTTEGGRSP